MRLPLSNDYHPMTANEAGEKAGTPSWCATPHCAERFGHVGDHHVLPNYHAEPNTPSKPCTEGGDHCFCVPPNHCCWCDMPRGTQRVPGHGPYRTELVRE